MSIAVHFQLAGGGFCLRKMLLLDPRIVFFFFFFIVSSFNFAVCSYVFRCSVSVPLNASMLPLFYRSLYIVLLDGSHDILHLDWLDIRVQSFVYF